MFTSVVPGDFRSFAKERLRRYHGVDTQSFSFFLRKKDLRDTCREADLCDQFRTTIGESAGVAVADQSPKKCGMIASLIP
jgi:hypothetical protein